LGLPNLEHAKTAVLNSLTSASGQRTYDHAISEFVGWYCSEPRLAFNRTVVLRSAFTWSSVTTRPRRSTSGWLPSGGVAHEAADAGLLSPELAAGIRRVKGVRRLGVRLGNWFTANQGRRLLRQGDLMTVRERRDHGMLAVLIGCGRRRGELLALRLESLQHARSSGSLRISLAKVGTSAGFPCRPGLGDYRHMDDGRPVSIFRDQRDQQDGPVLG
jgi:integrase